MNSTVSKDVTVNIDLDLKELHLLVGMLNSYKRDIADKLPDGTPIEESIIINHLKSLKDEASR